jgi:hypothetical protein
MPFIPTKRKTLEDSGLPSFVTELDRVFERKDYAAVLNAVWKSKPPGIDFKVRPCCQCPARGRCVCVCVCVCVLLLSSALQLPSHHYHRSNMTA